MYTMPAQTSFYTNSDQEIVLSSTEVSASFNSIIVTAIVTSPIYSSMECTTKVGTFLCTKQVTSVNGATSGEGLFATFSWQFQFSEGNILQLPANELDATFNLAGSVVILPNPTELLPLGASSQTYNGSANSAHGNGEFLNQFGYLVKTKYATSPVRKFDVYFPQLIAQYTNAFNSLPQPSLAPSA